MKSVTAREIMNPSVFTVSADWTIHELAQFLISRAITGAPVIDESGEFVGVVSLTDVARYESLVEKTILAERPHDYYLTGWEEKLNADDL